MIGFRDQDLREGFKLLFEMIEYIEGGYLEKCRDKSKKLDKIQSGVYGERFEPGNGNPIIGLQDQIMGYSPSADPLEKRDYLGRCKDGIAQKMRELGIVLD